MKKIKTGTDNPLLCYIGDLPDQRVDGITNSFDHNLKILSDYFNIKSIPENSGIQNGFFIKIKTVILFWKNAFNHISNQKPKVTYLNLPVSTLGIIKVLVIVTIALRYGSKNVLHVHRGDFLKKIHSSGFHSFLVSRMLKRVDAIIVLSKTESQSLNHLFSTSKFTYLPNTVNAPTFKKQGRSKRSGYLFISNYLKSKGIYDLLEVFSDDDLNNLMLECHGRFPSSLQREKLNKYASSNISINEAVGGDKKYTVMQKAKCLILPSWVEGQPLVILEAMSQELPVIASNVGYVHELLGKDYPFFFSPRDKERLKEVIIKMEQIDDVDSLGQTLRERFLEHFSPDKHRERLTEIFKPYMN